MKIKRVIKFQKEVRKTQDILETDDEFEILEITKETKDANWKSDYLVEYEDYSYEYSYRVETDTYPRSGWKVKVLDKTKTSYTKICSYINGEPVISLFGTFRDCKYLEKAPKIPSTILNMNYTFDFCTSIKILPDIPESVRIMEDTFNWCKNLIELPNIPATVLINKKTFEGCDKIFKNNNTLAITKNTKGVRDVSTNNSRWCTIEILYEDYKYEYNSDIGGWKVKVIDDEKTHYSRICDYVCNIPVKSLERTFESCRNLKESP